MKPEAAATDLELAVACGLLTTGQAIRGRDGAASIEDLIPPAAARFLDWFRELPESDRRAWLSVRLASLGLVRRLVAAGEVTLSQAADALQDQIEARERPCRPVEAYLLRRGFLDANADLPTFPGTTSTPSAVSRESDTIVAAPGSVDDAQAETWKGPPRDGKSRLPAPGEAPKPEGRPFGKYVLIEEVGRGGCGTVYRAWQNDLCRIVALKTLSASESGAVDLARFQQEARLAARLRHPHIATVYEVGEVEGIHYIAMEFVDGPTFKDAILRKELDPDAALRRVRDVARALAYAHGEGVIHRDIKPENIMIAQDRSPRIMDFGLARQLTERNQITISGTILGTPAYMSPEQANGETHHLDGQTDVYSLGAVLYFALVGKPPFLGTSLIETMYQVIEKDPPPLGRLRPDLPFEVVVICETAMDKDRTRRYPGAAALADDLDRHLAGDPIQARPATWTHRMRKRARKHRALVRVTAGCVLALALGGWEYHRRTARLSAEAALREEETRALERKVAAERARRAEAQRLLDQARLLGGKDALAVLDKAVEADGEFVEALFTRASLRRAMGDGQGALADLDELLRIQPTDARAVVVRAGLLDQVFGEHDRALAEYDRLVEMDVKKEVALTARGRARQIRRDHDAAIADFTAALKVNPQYADARVNRGASYVQIGRLREALDDLHTVARQEPDNAILYHWLGVIHHSTSDYQEALRYADLAVQRNPMYADAWLQRSHSLSELGRLQEAEESCRRAASLRPRDVTALAVLGFVQKERGDLQAARETLERALQLEPASAAVLNNLGLVHQALRDYPKSLEFLDRALESNPNDAIALRNRARSYIDLGKWDQALADCDRALQINPYYPQVWLTRGDILFWQRKLVSSIRSHEKYLEMAPNDRYFRDGESGIQGALAFIRAAGKSFTPARDHAKESENALKAGDSEKAREHAAAAAKANPLLWSPHLLTARAAARARDTAAVREALIKARDAGFPFLPAFLQHPDLDSARDDPAVRTLTGE